MGRGGRSSSPSRGGGRRSSSSSRSSYSSTASAPAARNAPPPAARTPPPPAPAPVQQASGGGGMMSGLGRTMAEGMAWGAGSSMARMAVNSVMGGGSSHQHAPQQEEQYSGACKMDHRQLTECLNSSSNANNCDFYFTALQNCQANGEM